MKTRFAVAAVGLSVLVMVSSAGAAFTPFADGFESYSAGTFPSANWTLLYNGTGTANQVVTDAIARSDSQSMFLQGRSGWAAEITHLVSDVPDTLRLTGSLYMGNSSSMTAAFGMASPAGTWGTFWGRLYFASGDIYAYNGGSASGRSLLTTYATNTWYDMTVDYDFVNHRYGVTINGTDYGASFILPDGKPDRIRLSAGNGGTMNVWFDNVALSQVPEPATLALLAIGGLVILRRRRNV